MKADMRNMSEDNLYRTIFATRVFRDVADIDYISARTLYRNDCLEQFLVFAQQTIEKYLKAVLLYNNVKNMKSTHDLNKLLKKCEGIDHFNIFSSTKKFIDIINGFDDLRYAIYIFGAYSAERSYLIDLDHAVMDIRKYCTSDIDMSKKFSRMKKENLINMTRRGVLISGKLEKIKKDKKKFKNMRANLIWKNLYFSRVKKNTTFVSGWWSHGSGFVPKEVEKIYLSVKDYVFITKKARDYFDKDKTHS